MLASVVKDDISSNLVLTDIYPPLDKHEQVLYHMLNRDALALQAETDN